MLQATSMVVLFISLPQLALILIRAHNSILIQEIIIINRNVNINHHIRDLLKISELYCISHFKGYSLLTHVSSNQCIMALPKFPNKDPDVVGVILGKMFCVFCWRPLKCVYSCCCCQKETAVFMLCKHFAGISPFSRTT